MRPKRAIRPLRVTGPPIGVGTGERAFWVPPKDSDLRPADEGVVDRKSYSLPLCASPIFIACAMAFPMSARGEGDGDARGLEGLDFGIGGVVAAADDRAGVGVRVIHSSGASGRVGMDCRPSGARGREEGDGCGVAFHGFRSPRSRLAPRRGYMRAARRAAGGVTSVSKCCVGGAEAQWNGTG